jgi:predicted nuclease of restriction endonuclease-like RecB superfamily
MLPSPLLRARVSKGRLSPKYVTLNDETNALSKSIIRSYEASTGKKKEHLARMLKELEEKEPDYKLVRGLAELLERRCNYLIESPIDPKHARDLTFREASKRRAVSFPERSQVIQDVSDKLKVDPSDIENSLWKDLEEEQILKGFLPIDSKTLIKQYNFALAQTALFKSTKMEFTSSGNWKNIFRDLKYLGLMYAVEKKKGNDDGKINEEGYTVSMEGPLSLFKLTDRYGTSFAKLLNQIILSDSWSFKAELFDRIRNRILYFEEDSGSVFGLFESNWTPTEPTKYVGAAIVSSPKKSPFMFQRQNIHLYDSKVEEKFASGFNALRTGWALKREPEPLVAGSHVLIPDFSFDKEGLKVYLEIVGFWTTDYLERKLAKLSSLSPDIEMIVAADESLACSTKFERLKQNSKRLLLFYSKVVPISPILGYLNGLDAVARKRRVEILRKERFEFHEDIITIKRLADERHVSLESMNETFSQIRIDGYAKIGDYLVSLSKISKLKRELRALGDDSSLARAVEMIESEGLQNPQQVLSALGYTIDWQGLDYEKSKIRLAN